MGRVVDWEVKEREGRLMGGMEEGRERVKCSGGDGDREGRGMGREGNS